MSVCEDCQFFERCPKKRIDLKTDDCNAFRPADEKTKQYREVYKRIIQIVLWGDLHDKEEENGEKA